HFGRVEGKDMEKLRKSLIAVIGAALLLSALLGLAGCNTTPQTTPTQTAPTTTQTTPTSTQVAPAFAWTWQNPLPQGNAILTVWGSSATDVFAVGLGGTIMHYNGSTWSAMNSGSTNDLVGVWGSSA